MHPVIIIEAMNLFVLGSCILQTLNTIDLEVVNSLCWLFECRFWTCDYYVYYASRFDTMMTSTDCQLIPLVPDDGLFPCNCGFFELLRQLIKCAATDFATRSRKSSLQRFVQHVSTSSLQTNETLWAMSGNDSIA